MIFDPAFLVSIQTWALNSYSLPVQKRMAGANTGVYESDSMDTNEHDEYIVDDWL